MNILKHYKNKNIEPIVYIQQNNLNFEEGNVIKYITRWRDKGGIEDLRKAKNYIDYLIKYEEEKNTHLLNHNKD